MHYPLRMNYANDLIRARAAFADGRLSGLDIGESESACPFTRSDLHLRGAWMDGFMIGRVERQIREGGLRKPI
jgi:ribosome modulation factor